VAISLPPSRLTHKISTCREQRVYEMWRVSASRRKTFPAPSLNMINENLKHWITAGGPRCISNYQRGAQSGLPSRNTIWVEAMTLGWQIKKKSQRMVRVRTGLMTSQDPNHRSVLVPSSVATIFYGWIDRRQFRLPVFRTTGSKSCFGLKWATIAHSV